MRSSQMALLTAATEAADAAHAVTSILKSKLDDSLKRFETTAKLIDDALIVASTDGEILSHNPASSRIFGCGSLTHINVSELFHHPHHVLTADIVWSECSRHSKRRSGVSSILRGRRLSDGHLFPIDPACASLDWSDGSRSMLLLVRNQEHLSSIQLQMIEAKRQFEALFENSFDGVVVIKDNIIVAANSSVGEIFGIPSHLMLGHNLNDYLATHATDSSDLPEDDVHCASAIGKHSSGSLRSLVLSSNSIPWNNTSAHLLSIKDISATPLSDSD